MPRYYKNHGRGYDLDLELPFCDVDGIGRVLVGSPCGSFIMVCVTCGEEHFRDEMRAWCFQGHGPMVPLTAELSDRLQPIMEARGVKYTTIDYRRARRLEREGKHPRGWVFGRQTEADYPRGYCKEGAADAVDGSAASP